MRQKGISCLLKIHNAVEKIRKGHGPQFLEFFTYRWREHCGPNFDNNIGYRTEQEYQEWLTKDPVAALERKVMDLGWIRNDQLREIDSEIEFEVG